MRRGAVLIVLASSAALAQRGAFNELPVGAAPTSLSREVVVDAERGRVFGLTPDRTVVALSLETGRRLWSEPAARDDVLHQPLLTVGDALLTLASQPGGVAVRALGQSDGKLWWRSKTIALPEWTSVAETRPGDLFEAWAVRDGSAATVCWRASRHLVMGIPPKPGQAEAYARDESGASKVAAGDGALGEAKPCEKLRNVSVPPPVSALLEKGWSLVGAPVEVNGKVLAAVELRSKKGTFTWLRWSVSGKPELEKKVAPELHGDDVGAATAGGLYLFRSAEKVELRRPFDEAVVATLPSTLPDELVPHDPAQRLVYTRIAEAQRIKDRVVTVWRSHGQDVTPAQLVVFDLAGQKVWSQALLDFESRPPPPP